MSYFWARPVIEKLRPAAPVSPFFAPVPLTAFATSIFFFPALLSCTYTNQPLLQRFSFSRSLALSLSLGTDLPRTIDSQTHIHVYRYPHRHTYTRQTLGDVYIFFSCGCYSQTATCHQHSRDDHTQHTVVASRIAHAHTHPRIQRAMTDDNDRGVDRRRRRRRWFLLSSTGRRWIVNRKRERDRERGSRERETQTEIQKSHTVEGEKAAHTRELRRAHTHVVSVVLFLSPRRVSS